jgi:hypothetical protein
MNTVHIGFTGTRKGMTPQQKHVFEALIIELTADPGLFIFHHGDCKGADAEAHAIVQSKLPHIGIVLHPAQHKDRAGCGFRKGGSPVTIFDPKPPLQRNQDIVDACSTLIACPGNSPRLRSGTWATVRSMQKKASANELFVIMPDGFFGP